MTTDVQQPPSRTWIERVLSPVAEVHREEVTSALLMTLVMFLILAAYYLLKTAREVFILSEGGAEVKSYSSAGQALLLLVLVPLYSSFASRVRRVQLVQWVTVFFASHLILFLLALGAGVQDRHLLLPLGRHLQSHGDRAVLGVRHRPLHAGTRQAALSADRRREQSRRMGGSLRAGSVMEQFGPTRLLIVRRRSARRVRCPGAGSSTGSAPVQRRRRGRAATKDEPLTGPNGFALLFADRYLLLIAALILVLNVVNTSGEYLFGRYVVETAKATYGAGPDTEAARQQFIGATYSRLFSTVNLLGFLLQMFAVSRIFKFLGVGARSSSTRWPRSSATRTCSGRRRSER